MLHVTQDTQIIVELLKIVDQQSAREFYWKSKKCAVLVDMQSANLLLSVYTGISPKHQVIMESELKRGLIGFERSLQMAWNATSMPTA